jgi:hypothetical protein
VVRELRKEDAEAAARIGIAVNPHRIETGELVWHRASTPPPQALRRDWVAESLGEVDGHAFAGVKAAGK